ncbi:MAG: sulfatase, partial [bacterium]
MARLKKISSEFGALCILMALAQAGWHTSISAATIHRTLKSAATWIHYSIDALFGFAVLSFALLILPAIFSLFIKVKPSEDENRAIRRFLLAGAIGLGLAVVFPLINTEAVVQLLPDQTGYRMAIIIFGMVIFAFIAGAIISSGIWSIIEKKPAGYQWRFFWGWWFFMVTAPPIGMVIKDKLPIDNVPIKMILILLVAAFFLYLAIKLLPRLINLLNHSRFAGWGIVFICTLLVYIFTSTPKPSVQKGLAATKETPPIILITIDTVRTDALDCYPEKKCLRLGTPSIDGLAEDGTLFENAYSTSPWTLPSVASFLTGLPPTAHGAIDEKNQGIGRGATNLAEILKASGWATGAVVVNPILLPKSGLGDGFDYYNEIYSELGRSGKLPFQRIEYKIKTNTLGHHDLIDNYVQERLAVKRALEFIDRHKGERFFLWLHFFAPHAPYYPPKSYRVEAESKFDVQFKTGELMTNAQLNTGMVPIDPERLKRILALYAGEIKFTDDNVGDFIKGAGELIDLNDCMVILSADHGEEFYDHDRIA